MTRRRLPQHHRLQREHQPAWPTRSRARRVPSRRRVLDPLSRSLRGRNSAAELRIGSASTTPMSWSATARPASDLTCWRVVMRWRRPVVVTPTFSEISNALISAAAPPHAIQLSREDAFTLHDDDVTRELEDGADAILLGRPNSPTGVMVPLDQASAIALNALASARIAFSTRLSSISPTTRRSMAALFGGFQCDRAALDDEDFYRSPVCAWALPWLLRRRSPNLARCARTRNSQRRRRTRRYRMRRRRR